LKGFQGEILSIGILVYAHNDSIWWYPFSNNNSHLSRVEYVMSKRRRRS